MPATAGSVYQAARLEHIAGRPPNTDPQRASENFNQYVSRMAANGLNPDIGATESDSEYAARLSTYAPAPATASIALFAVSASFASFATSASFAP